MSDFNELVSRVQRLERFIDGSSMQCAEMSQRIEKTEEALSKEMAKTHEMDDILAGVVKRVGYVSDEPSEVLVCAPGDSIADPMAELIKWLDAEIATTKENIDLIKQHNGGLKPLIQFEAILATYRAVKAHITG